MKKILLIGAGVIIIGGSILAYVLSTSESSVAPTVSSSPVTFPIASSTVVQGNINETPGAEKRTSSILEDPATVQDPLNPGYYYLGYHLGFLASTTGAINSPPYVITYIASTNYFNVALLQEPIGTVRIQAEQYLLTHLGMSSSQLCQLNYMVSVPDRVNSQFSSKNLGFSFCPGATPLPQ